MVEALLDRKGYIFPGDATKVTFFLFTDLIYTDCMVKPNTLRRDKPYNNSVIHTALQEAFFKDTKSIGMTLHDRYISSIEDDDEVELPASMLALVATGVCHSL